MKHKVIMGLSKFDIHLMYNVQLFAQILAQ